MASARQQRLWIIATAFVVTALFYWQRISSGDFNLFTGLPNAGSKFSWKDFPLHFPPNITTPLPVEPPRELPAVQYVFQTETRDEKDLRESRQRAVKAAFLRSWASYKKYAWTSDELLPISAGRKDKYGGWAASLVDNLDTLWMMDLRDEFRDAISAALKIRFDVTGQAQVNVFETTIRYLGGFLSAFDLSGDSRLLDKATEIGDMLLVAFDTPNNLPVTRWNMLRAKQGRLIEPSDGTLVAELGSLSLEFTRLSQRTGDNRYYSAIHRITLLFAEQQNQTLLPGMWPVMINTRKANMTENNVFGLGGMSDSAYEYIPKMHALMGGTVPEYPDMYRTFSATALAHLIVRPMVPDNKDILLATEGRVIRSDRHLLILDNRGQHLSCFAGGMFALAGKLLSLPEHVSIGRKLTDGCVWTYHAMPSGIMPEIFSMSTCPRLDACAWNETRWREDVNAHRRATAYFETTNEATDRFILDERLPKGFTSVLDKRYQLRPEAIESVFILYRITGEKRYMDDAWTMFEAILEASWTDYANALVVDVTVDRSEAVRVDTMESFWMAETLKYFYLIFSEPSFISLDEYVFNTEAHPFRRPIGYKG